MKNWIPWTLFLLGCLIVLRPAPVPEPLGGGQTMESFAETPVLSGGRIQPLDSVARNSLRLLSGKSSFVDPEGVRHEAIRFLADLAFAPAQAASHRVFRIDHPDLTGLLGVRNEERKYFGLNEIMPHIARLQEQVRLTSGRDRAQQGSYERALLKLWNALQHYRELANSFGPQQPLLPTRTKEFQRASEIAADARQVAELEQAGKAIPEALAMAPQALRVFASHYQELADQSFLHLIPPHPDFPDSQWSSLADSLLMTLSTGQLDPMVAAYGEMSEAYAAGNWDGFRHHHTAVWGQIAKRAQDDIGKIGFEYFFGRYEVFIRAMALYVFLFLVVLVSWMACEKPLQRGAFLLLILAFGLHTFGLLARMYLQGRPPVTNLYSSAVFTGWFAVLLALILERLHKNGFSAAVAAIIGFATLVIAHGLAADGDTLEMMRAVLDSNFWLATHVVTITMGYSATFLAGMLAALYMIADVFTTGLSSTAARSLNRMVYAITCFALLFSFVGTVLGGIWADQSWGRFWGWDPKENGALMIVLWHALVLHARWGRICRETGIMTLAVFGNIITAWSWFGTNLLGVGLHSYGFTESGFFWLSLFWVSQFAIMALALIPRHHWRSAAT